jgi:cullin-4
MTQFDFCIPVFSCSRPNASLNPSISLAQSQQRKMVIKPFKVQPKLPENFENETWEKLKLAIASVYNKNASVLSKEELYRVSCFR